MEIEYDLTTDDLINYQRYDLQNSRLWRKRRRYGEAIVPLIIFAMGVINLIAYWGFDQPDVSSDILFVVTSTLVTAVIWHYIYKSHWYQQYIQRAYSKRFLAYYREGRNKTLLGAHRLIIFKEGFTGISDGVESKAQWDIVEKIIQISDYVFIYIGTSMAIIVPRRAFPNQSSLQEFVDTVKQYCALSEQ
jgi:hypothetical protein